MSIEQHNYHHDYVQSERVLKKIRNSQETYQNIDKCSCNMVVIEMPNALRNKTKTNIAFNVQKPTEEKSRS